MRHGGLAGGQEWQHGRCAARAGDGREDESEALEGTQMVLFTELDSPPIVTLDIFI